MNNEILKYNRLRDVRNQKGLTQAELAKILGISQNTISQYETTDRSIPSETLVKLALIYETSLDYLVGLTDESIPYGRSKIFLMPYNFHSDGWL